MRRYGRNQKRRHLARIAELELDVAYLRGLYLRGLVVALRDSWPRLLEAARMYRLAADSSNTRLDRYIIEQADAILREMGVEP